MISKLQRCTPFILVVLISSLIFFINLGNNTLADWDEAWYADASRTMFRTSHFLTPMWNNYYFFDKPPLQYWLTQPFLWLLGEKEISYRLPSAISCIGLVALTFLWGKKRYGLLGGIAASAILLSFPHFIDRGRSGNFDGVFIFLTTLSLFLFLKRRFWAAGIALGLSWMTKGVFSGFFPVIVIGLFAFYEQLKWRTQTVLKPLFLMACIAIAIYAPWHVLQAIRFHDVIAQSYFSTLDQGEFGDWSWMSIVWRFDLRYLVFLWTFLRWWFPIVLVSLAYQFAKLDLSIHQKQDEDIWGFVDRFLPLAVFMTIFIALSAALEKNDWYIMPTYPFIALMIVDVFMQFMKLLAGSFINFYLMSALILIFSFFNIFVYRQQAFPQDRWLVERQVGEYVRSKTSPNDLVVTAEYEFPTLRYYSEREIRTAAPQQDLQGKYWWVWDAKDIADVLRKGRSVVTIHRPGAEWLIDVPGYVRENIGEINGRFIDRLVPG